MSLKSDKLNFIKQFAFEQFQRYGFSRVTMDEIAKETKTGKGTLYRYFPSKEDLLIACIENNITEIEKYLQKELENKVDPIEKINSYILLLSKKLKNVQTSQLADIEKNVPKAFEMICEARERLIINTLASIIEEGKEEGIFRTDLNVDFVVKILIGAAEYITRPNILDTIENTNLTEVIREICYTFFQGCFSEEGRKKERNLNITF